MSSSVGQIQNPGWVLKSKGRVDSVVVKYQRVVPGLVADTLLVYEDTI